MPTHSTTNAPISAFRQELRDAEAEHPVAAGSLHNIKLLVAVDDSTGPAEQPKANLSGDVKAGSDLE